MDPQVHGRHDGVPPAGRLLSSCVAVWVAVYGVIITIRDFWKDAFSTVCINYFTHNYYKHSARFQQHALENFEIPNVLKTITFVIRLM